jgi:hypothetical protein
VDNFSAAFADCHGACAASQRQAWFALQKPAIGLLLQYVIANPQGDANQCNGIGIRCLADLSEIKAADLQIRW